MEDVALIAYVVYMVNTASDINIIKTLFVLDISLVWQILKSYINMSREII